MRAAVSKTSIPAAGGRLLKVLAGSPESKKVGLGSFTEKLERHISLFWLSSVGFPSGYFNDCFLRGADFALDHAAANLLPALHASTSAVDVSSAMEVNLQHHIANGCETLRESGLELVWNIDEVSNAELGRVGLVFGARRSKGTPPKGAFRTDLLNTSLVLQPSTDGASTAPTANIENVMKSFYVGATVWAEVYLSARQTTLIREAADVNNILVADYNEAALHCIRLEAELEPVAHESNSGNFQKLSFDEERGWVIADINGCLDGNSVIATIRNSKSS